MRIKSALVIAVWVLSVRADSSSLPPTRVSADGAEMVLVPAGTFLMGSNAGNAEESPPHTRVLRAFYVDRTEVTCARYAAFVSATGHPAPPGWTGSRPPPGTEDLPVTNIRWTDALRYAVWAGKRLPTEAEWEKAARGTDGRWFPWGNVDHPAHRNKDSGKLSPVGQYPSGASCYGLFDMIGNAWEWTADWFEPYPGSSSVSPHFGRHYKVIRGGGAEYLYGADNSGTTFQRARLAPYGAHDFVGFRCVMDPPGQQPPYNPADALAEVEQILATPLPAPRALAHEKEFAALNTSGEIPVRVEGTPGQTGLVNMGLPFPRGRIVDPRKLRLLDPNGTEQALAVEKLASWPDGSLRWALLRFPSRNGDTATVQLDSNRPRQDLGVERVSLTTNGTILSVSNGAIKVDFDPTTGLKLISCNGREVCKGLDLTFALQDQTGRRILQAGPVDALSVQSKSDLHADIRWRGRFFDSEGRPGPMMYDLRLRVEAAGSRLRFWLTALHAVARRQPWERLEPQLEICDWRLSFHLANPGQQRFVGCEGQSPLVCEGRQVELYQKDNFSYLVNADGRELSRGARAPGWIGTRTGDAFTTLGVRDFWQNHPKSLFANDNELGARLWAGDGPMAWEGGLAKTHEFVLEIHDTIRSPEMVPLLGIAPPAWVCGSGAAGELLPRNEDALRQLGYWEAWREDSMIRWVNAMPTGIRDFGDAYMGGPYKGKNAFLNLEYDVPLNFLNQFLRTGQRWYFDAAEPMVRHQTDIDTENVAGFAWKHSPLHTTTEAEFGHVFVRGLLLHHLLTGDPRDLEIAEKLGAAIAEQVSRGAGIGNERQIGWSLYALSALHEVTANARYLDAALKLARRLAKEQSPTGKFNIRWDNRIAFFNGIAVNGLLSVNDLAPDSLIEQAVVRLADRTLGMYPEYAGRTLNGWCWVLDRIHDPRFLHNLGLTWTSTLEFLLERDTTTAETHAWRYPVFAARYNLFPQFDDNPGELPSPESWRALRFKKPELELFIQPRTHDDVPLVVVREGLAMGTVELYTADGKVHRRMTLDRVSDLIQSVRLDVPARERWLRLRLQSQKAAGWQVQYDQRLGIVAPDKHGELLPFLLPRAYGVTKNAAREIKLHFEVTGEGFHSAVLFDPAGVPVRRVGKFVDFGDQGRYELELSMPSNGQQQGWSLELNGVRILKTEGFLPYWSAGQQDWFNPETEAAGQ